MHASPRLTRFALVTCVGVASFVGLSCASPPAASPREQAVTGAAAAPASQAPAPAPLQKLNVAGVAVTYAQMALPVAKETGLFEKHGLDAEVSFGARSVTALMAGELQAASVSTEDVVTANLGGANLVSIASMVPTIQHKVIVPPDVTSMADLRGKTVAVSKRGSLPHTVLRMAARRDGIDPERDLTVMEVTDTATTMAALTSGAVSAVALVPPYSDIAERNGMRILYDFAKERLDYSVVSLAVTRDWAARNDAAVLAFLRAITEAVHVIHNQPELAAEIYARWAGTGPESGPPAVALAREVLPVKMSPTAAGIQRVLDAVADATPAAATADPTQFFDDRYVRQLEQEGFYARLGVN